MIVSRVSVWVFGHGVVSVHRNDLPEIAEVLNRLDANPDLVSNGPMGIVHAILDVLVDGHFDTVQHLDDVVEDVEDQLFDDSIDTQQVQLRVYRLRKELVQFRRIVLPMREIVSTICRPSREAVAVPRVLELISMIFTITPCGCQSGPTPCGTWWRRFSRRIFPSRMPSSTSS
ncbi:magnesium and cobalt transport protein CorA [Cutibacterium acnes JCM 18918]|nr:magnesium and cobalt transport protein CorA [Cutibacterium acnes JCM 18918]